MVRQREGVTYAIVYNGEVYNAPELRKELEEKGEIFDTTADTEVVLVGFMRYGAKIVDRLNGIYSFVIWNERNREIFFCRDRVGVKPLFYSMENGVFLFASEIKALLATGIKPVINRYGLCELFGI